MRFPLHRLTLVAMAMLLAGSWLAASSHPQAQRSGSAQAELRAAMDKETVDGDLPAAIKLYLAIADKYAKTDHATAATALVHLGECYQRLGDTQARATWEQILKDFPDVSEAAATARARLTALGAIDGSALSMRRVYTTKDTMMPCVGLSSDGRYLAHPDSSLDNLIITDVRTGQVRQVWASQAAKGSASVMCAAFSPDDRQIAFNWLSKDSSEIRIIGVNGTGLRTLYTGAYSEPLDWSPDGLQILAASFRRGGTLTLLSIQVETGATRVLKPDALWGQGSDVHAAFSADGGYVAYSAQASTETGKYDVFVMKSDGTGDAAVVQHPANDTFLGWSPDGGTVFFSSDRTTGTNSVWSIEVTTGRPRGAPVLVKNDVGGIVPVRMIGGTLYYGTGLRLSDVFLASLDPATGRGGESRSAKAGLTGSDHDPDWSPDGRSLAYRSSGESKPVVSILNVQTGEERQLRPSLERLNDNDGPRWSPDGRSLLVIGMRDTPEHGVYKVDAQTGATTPLFKVPAGQMVIYAVWSRDGRSVFYAIGGGGGVRTRFVRRDLASGADVDLVSMKSGIGAAHLALSPDGQRLAFTAMQSLDPQLAALNVVPTSGGAVQPLYRAPATENEIVLMPVWSPDGRHVYFRKTGQTTEYWRVGADGSGAEKTTIVGPERNFSISPDGRTIAFNKTERRTELWALENLAPKKAGR